MFAFSGNVFIVTDFVENRKNKIIKKTNSNMPMITFVKIEEDFFGFILPVGGSKLIGSIRCMRNIN